jgi:hypothetical protein
MEKKMNEQTECREYQKELTRDILERIDIVSFTLDMAGQNKG